MKLCFIIILAIENSKGDFVDQVHSVWNEKKDALKELKKIEAYWNQNTQERKIWKAVNPSVDQLSIELLDEKLKTYRCKNLFTIEKHEIK